jgi:glycerol-3-phosphate cytidylyltransferase-like family protein
MINVIVSGFFNPIGVHHINYIDASYKEGCGLAWPWEKVQLHIIINGDKQVKLKGSCPFQSAYERASIVEKMYKKSNIIIDYSHDNNVSFVIERILDFHKARKTIFCNGGDRTIHNANLDEINICNRFDVEMRFGVGGSDKISSSSMCIEHAARWWIKNKMKEGENYV